MDKKTLMEMGLTEEQADAVLKGLDGAFVPKARFNEVNEAKKDLEGEVAAFKKTAKSDDDGAETAALKLRVEALEQEKTDAEVAHETALAAVRRDAAIERALLSSQARNPKAVMALLNLDALKLEGDTLTGLNEQLSKIKGSDAYLFADAKNAPPPMFGVVPAESSDPSSSGTVPQTLEQAIGAHLSAQSKKG